MSHSPAEVQKHIKTYVAVFIALAILTAATVGVSYLHMAPVMAVTVALFIATIKASLVACYFMHLISEKKMIRWILIITMFLFLDLLIIVLLSDHFMMRALHVP